MHVVFVISLLAAGVLIGSAVVIRLVMGKPNQAKESDEDRRWWQAIK